MRPWRMLWLVLALLFACEENKEDREKLDAFLEEPETGVESFGVEYIFSDSANVNAQMFATHVVEKEELLEGEPKGKMVHYLDQGIRLNFLNLRGQVYSYIEADSGIFYRDDNIARLIGNVYLKNHKGESLSTEELNWNQEKDSIFTDKLVHIVTPDKDITGKEGLKAKGDFSSYSIYGIVGEVEAEEAGL
ncbi:LPS export ABC transporter periplasmic protein LptC [Pontibacter sp. G13]|uniref:LPS export ABC transporter periplasmic protein LptC n=1 Tax=Pontibacter sp. G13 TaxID=3074898 RepID=UPI00288933F9|nr:LPS export ABC transporter periplasmic protein LptC [Pontibacter sp. G13]WNJ21272.1 LPS export ABC transporter periplasmic protein LptC [Pontibacter sp. G13]